MQYEITLTSDTIQQVANILTKYNIKNISIVDKAKYVDRIQLIHKLKQLTPPSLDITVHYSIQHHYDRNLNELVRTFKQFVDRAASTNISKFLIVSGSQKRVNTSVELFERLRSIRDIELYCACNPYLENTETEINRLKQKLRICNGVYFQIGESVDTLDSILSRRDVKNILKNKKRFGCLLLPTPYIKQAMRFRPWKGVYLSKKYLEHDEYARSVFKDFLRYYTTNNTTPLVEIIPFNQHNLKLHYKTVAD